MLHITTLSIFLICLYIFSSCFTNVISFHLPILSHSREALLNFNVFCKEYIVLNQHASKRINIDDAPHSISVPTFWNCPKSFWSFLQWRRMYLSDSFGQYEAITISGKRRYDSHVRGDRKNSSLELLNDSPMVTHSTSKSSKVSINTKVLVVGLGPNGLLTALELLKVAYTNHAIELIFVDKRSQYTRNIWFDLYPEPYAPSMKVINEIGLYLIESFIEKQIQYAPNKLWTIRCQVLEKLLFWYIFQVLIHDELHVENVSVLRGFEFLSLKNVPLKYIEPSTSASFLNIGKGILSTIKSKFFGKKYFSFVSNIGLKNISSSISNGERKIKTPDQLYAILSNRGRYEIGVPFDILIGTDGTSSRVRKTMNINYDVGRSIVVQENDIQVNITMSDIHQTAILLNFKSINASGRMKCPESVIDTSTNQVISPWKPSFLIKGVLAVFKRFYSPENEGYCQLQILIDNALERQFQKDGLTSDNPRIWDFLLSVTNTVLKHKSKNVQHLQQRLESSKFKILPVRISHSSPHALQLKNQLIILHGDSSVSAHFRLGIGVNNGFRALRSNELTQLLQERQSDPNSAFNAYLKVSSRRISSMINYQLVTIYFESYCNVYVFPDGAELYFYLRNYKTMDFEPISLINALKRCESDKGIVVQRL